MKCEKCGHVQAAVASALPPGHWAAPDEATEGMIAAGNAYCRQRTGLTDKKLVTECYRAMRLAHLNKPETPTPPAA